MSRLVGAILKVRQSIVVATGRAFLLTSIDADDDLIDDLALDELELESLGLLLEEVFAISVPDELWLSPLHRTPAGLAEWCVRQSELAAWESRNGQRRSA